MPHGRRLVRMINQDLAGLLDIVERTYPSRDVSELRQQPVAPLHSVSSLCTDVGGCSRLWRQLEDAGQE